ncbi:MAG TPA: class I SAM-dependent methyltransferase [Pseudonocardiaceae bacterium]
MLSAFPALQARRHGADTVLAGLLDRSAFYGVLVEAEALGLDLVEVRRLAPDRDRRSLADMTAIRLIGPPAADGEYVALDEHEVIHLHDYPRIYAVPGLYERIVQEHLRCRSPQVAVEGFLRAITRLAMGSSAMTVLDFGSGTGLVGELLHDGGIARVVGVDSLAAGRAACLRDRPGVYADYLVGDVGSDSGTLSARLRGYALGGLVSAGAFGGAHAPPAALINALSVLPAGAPVSITIHEQWMDRADPDGFGAAIARLEERGDFVPMERHRFQHRVTTTGEPIFYELIVGTTGR